MNQLTYFFEGSAKAYIIGDTCSKKIIYTNKVAKEIYDVDENTNSLEEIFQNCTLRLDEMIEEMLEHHTKYGESSNFHDLYTVTEDGKEYLIDLAIGFLNSERTEILLEFTFKTDERDRSLKDMVDHTSKPMFIAYPDENLTIYYGNDLFYEIFSSDKSTFSTYYKKSFLSSLLDVDKETFVKDVFTRLKKNPDFYADIQITTVQGAKKWFYLDMQFRQIGKDQKVLAGLLLPIAERVTVKEQRQNMNRYFLAVQELTQGALFYVDARTKTASHYSKALKQAGFPEQMENFPDCVLPMFHPDDRKGFLEHAIRMLHGNKDPYEVRYRTGTESHSWARIATTPIFDDQDILIELVGRIQNIDAEKELEDRCTIDPLTNAYNKEYARELIENVIELAQPDMIHAFFFMDLDDFTYVNEHLGKKFGDFLLKELGNRLAEELRSDDVIGRVGGDEFIFFLKNVKKMEILLTKANNILETIGRSVNDGTTEHIIHGSIGIAIYPIHGKTYDELYENADSALYRSKHRGKNMATIYKPPQNQGKKKENQEDVLKDCKKEDTP